MDSICLFFSYQGYFMPQISLENYDKVFDRVRVSHLISSGTVVTWDLKPNFNDRGPYTFQLYTGRTGNPYSDDWYPVDTPKSDVWFLQDSPKQRLWGKTNWTFFSIRLQSAEGVYFSKPEQALGNWTMSDWIQVKNVIRRQRQNFRLSKANRGLLLKRKYFGEPCACLDRQTADIANPDCITCYGTGYVGGYYQPLDYVFCQLPAEVRDAKLEENRGVTETVILSNTIMLNDPPLYEYDVWVDWQSDDRYFIRAISSITELRGRPIVVSPQLRLIPFNDVMYKYPINKDEVSLLDK